LPSTPGNVVRAHHARYILQSELRTWQNVARERSERRPSGRSSVPVDGMGRLDAGRS
jgi:hypothetical protein